LAAGPWNFGDSLSSSDDYKIKTETKAVEKVDNETQNDDKRALNIQSQTIHIEIENSLDIDSGLN
jgi:hypothetical protein